MSTPPEGYDWPSELLDAWLQQHPTALGDAYAALFPPTIPACLAGPSLVHSAPKPMVDRRAADAIAAELGVHADDVYEDASVRTGEAFVVPREWLR